MKEHSMVTFLQRDRTLSAIAIVAICCVVSNVCKADSAPSRYLGGNQRTGYVDATVPKQPVLQWIYQEKHPPRHAWREPNREVQYIDFDYATQVAIGNGTVFFGSSADHKVYALNLATGAEKWTFYTQGPVRFAPAIHGDRVYVASDDGYLYCLDTTTGEKMWVFCGGPGDDKLIGNDQMISHWPARSGVLIEDNKLFFTAGMWSRDGVFIYCLDADRGETIWRNDTSGLYALDFRTGRPQWSLTDRNIVAAREGNLILAGQGPVIKVDIDQLMKDYRKYWRDGKNLGHDKNISGASTLWRCCVSACRQ